MCSERGSVRPVMFRDIEDRCLNLGGWLFAGAAGWGAGGLVVAGGVDGEFAEDLAGGGVGDLDGRPVLVTRTVVPAWRRPRAMWRRRPSWLCVMVPFDPTRPVRVAGRQASGAGAALGRAA